MNVSELEDYEAIFIGLAYEVVNVISLLKPQLTVQKINGESRYSDVSLDDSHMSGILTGWFKVYAGASPLPTLNCDRLK